MEGRGKTGYCVTNKKGKGRSHEKTRKIRR